jgi:hypothetical protein
MRQAMDSHRVIAKKLAELESKVGTHDEELKLIFEALRQLTAPAKKQRRAIGFGVKGTRGRYHAKARPKANR